MRYSDMRVDGAVIAELHAKKRLGPRQKERLAMLSARVDTAAQPPATPSCPNTGERGDFQGNVYAAHYRQSPTTREMQRGSKFGLAGCKPMRSRIQRTQRKRKTGGVK